MKFHNLWSIKRRDSSDHSQDDEVAMTDSDDDQTGPSTTNIDEDVSRKFKILSTVRKEAQIEENKMSTEKNSESAKVSKLGHNQFNYEDDIIDISDNDQPGLLDIDHGLIDNKEQDYFMKDLESMDRFLM